MTIYLFGLFKITKAPITPGIHPQRVSNNMMKNDPQPLSITDNGGNKIANKTRKKLIAKIGWLIKRRENETFVTQKSR
tara:strand:- start:11821 stop:12054 length:234 start_codon:yes stop_codon:yes gene_type:complete